MINFKRAVLVPSVAVMSMVGLVAAQVPASAQTNTHLDKRYNTKKKMSASRPLTVRRTAKVAPSGSPVTATNGLTGPGPGPVTAATGVASTVVGMPFQVLGGVFPAPGARKGGATSVRYAGAGKETGSIDEGFAAPIPVSMNGPVYVVENGDPTINPLSVIGAPISVAGQLAQTPFKIIGATGL